MKPIKINYTKSKKETRTSTTINGEIADAYFRTLVNKEELRTACESMEKYISAVQTKCQKYVNTREWQSKATIERFMINEIIQISKQK